MVAVEKQAAQDHLVAGTCPRSVVETPLLYNGPHPRCLRVFSEKNEENTAVYGRKPGRETKQRQFTCATQRDVLLMKATNDIVDATWTGV